jgi:hypothetical protein
MLGRKDYTQQEYDHAKNAIDELVAAYDRLVEAVGGTGAGDEVRAALEAFEPLLFNNMTMVLDRYFVHRIRPVAGKDGNPLNEVELITESLIDHDGAFHRNKVIKLVPEQSVLGLEDGQQIAISREDFERLTDAFLAELDSRFLSGARAG